MDPSQLGDFIAQHNWVGVAFFVTALGVRLFKSDTTLPTVPPRGRIWLAFGLGIASGVLEKVAAGTTWTNALVDGLVGTLIAIASHEAFIASLRSGKEIPIPGLMVEGKAPSPTAPVTVEAPGAVETRATPKFTMPPPKDPS